MPVVVGTAGAAVTARDSSDEDPGAGIVAALREVYDPCCRERGISVVDMGLIEDVQVDEQRAHIELVLTSGWCPFAVDLVEEITQAAGAAAADAEVSVEVVWDPVWEPGRMAEDARRKLRFLPEPSEAGDARAYAAAHGAGGHVPVHGAAAHAPVGGQGRAGARTADRDEEPDHDR